MPQTRFVAETEDPTTGEVVTITAETMDELMEALDAADEFDELEASLDDV